MIQLAGIMLLIVGFPAWSESTESQGYALVEGQLLVSLSLRNPPTREILERLREGLKSEIRFDVRVYQKTSGIFGFLGDKLIGECHPAYEAQWDEFSSQFIVANDDHHLYRFATAPAFAKFFFSLPYYATGVKIPPGHGYYMLTSVEVDATKLVPPLNMISLLVPIDRYTSAWERTRLAF